MKVSPELIDVVKHFVFVFSDVPLNAQEGVLFVPVEQWPQHDVFFVGIGGRVIAQSEAGFPLHGFGDTPVFPQFSASLVDFVVIGDGAFFQTLYLLTAWGDDYRRIAKGWNGIVLYQQDNFAEVGTGHSYEFLLFAHIGRALEVVAVGLVFFRAIAQLFHQPQAEVAGVIAPC